LEKWRGTIVVLLILGGVLLILGLNLDLSQRRRTGLRSPRSDSGQNNPPESGRSSKTPGSPGFREYPIGEDVEKNQMRIAAVWLPPVQMDGMTGPSSSSLIHVEADIHATEGNRHGFPKDEFVPYLTVRYTIVPIDEPSKSSSIGPIRGTMMPMTARDGWHYGASIEMPRAGRYKLTYAIEPPAAGRHSDPMTGVDPWWKPFEVSFDWDYPGPPTTQP
ncbi:MAG TPA: iron transporter, partial [Isosphaeraceae bacterium]|nr:iron transporter [Isosphaeraceae bacterium]